MKHWLRQQWLYILAPLLLWFAAYQLGFIEFTDAPKGPVAESPSGEVATRSEWSDAPADAASEVNPEDLFESPAGLRYGPDPSPKYKTRLAHIMTHTLPNPDKPKHSVFVEKDQKALVALLDEAWGKRGDPKKQGGAKGRDVYTVEMGRAVGDEGQTQIRIVVERDSADIVTAYPVKEE